MANLFLSYVVSIGIKGDRNHQPEGNQVLRASSAGMQ
jgi:hypothetical protein